MPSWIEPIEKGSIKEIWTYATAKVWINSHRIGSQTLKRKGQLFIWTNHGSPRIKKVGYDRLINKSKNYYTYSKIVKDRTAQLADVYLSGSHDETIRYRRSYHYYGTVFEIGYPRNEILFNDVAVFKSKVSSFFGFSPESKIYYMHQLSEILFKEKEKWIGMSTTLIPKD